MDAAQRRARLARRHALHPSARAASVLDATRRLVCLHATDPATVFLSAYARVGRLTTADVEKAMYADRTLIKHLAMRRTLFVFPREVLPAAQAGASERVAEAERKRVVKDVEAAGLHADGAAWLAAASAEVIALLADGREMSSTELRTAIPLLEGSMVYGEGKTWGGSVSFGPRVLTTLSAAGKIVRASNSGSWIASRPRWTSMSAWLGEPLSVIPEGDGVRRMVELWLRSFGPGTELDIKWWLGSTLGKVRAALAALDVVEVDLDGRTGYVLADDVDPEDDVDPWVALLPGLDPTVMGWFEREWYLGSHKAQVFDSVGNAGPTVWVDGRIVGGWRQDDAGAVEIQLLEKVGATARRAIAAEADRLTAWFGGTRVMLRFPSPLFRSAPS